MATIMAGDATEAQTAAFIVALRAKGETTDEMTGLVDAMYEAAVTVEGALMSPPVSRLHEECVPTPPRACVLGSVRGQPDR